MRVSTEVNGPSLAEVLAFVMIEEPQHIARVESLTANRMAAIRGWYGWKVTEVDVNEDADELVRLTVHAQPVGGGYRDGAVTFEFLTDQNGGRRSARLDAFLAACGVSERVNDTREICGRFFATKNRGSTARDFGPLTNALVG
ncbi:UNVERIFIED_ORG: hypothetical protein GGD58_002774 [Rhizobium pisi]